MKPPNETKTLITFWGTRGSISTPGRTTEKYGGNTPCVTVTHADTSIILDAGTGIRNLGIDLVENSGSGNSPLSLHLFLSHTHWDHIQGLPFFQPAYIRDTQLTIYGSPRKERFLDSVLEDQMDYEYFPIAMSALTAEISIHEISEEIIQVGPVVIDWQEQIYHPGGSVRYGLNINGKRIVYASDVELDKIFKVNPKNEETEALSEEYLSFISNADLLIADGQYTEEEYTIKIGWGHSSIPVVIDTAKQAGVKRLAIFHHDPQHSDSFLDDVWMKNRPGSHSKDHYMEVFWAREGLTLSI